MAGEDPNSSHSPPASPPQLVWGQSPTFKRERKKSLLERERENNMGGWWGSDMVVVVDWRSSCYVVHCTILRTLALSTITHSRLAPSLSHSSFPPPPSFIITPITAHAAATLLIYAP
ncbi:hypothetical protein HYC85_001285 [Camellia sinensis]|uniref:Uncharacterized protein n=1 Tax=Camellia sinensis TaxID=4442 RepID=A0A7J7I6F1_CAMSI|nr:hypothetical protein HYC85_001285 [Camellia sinensis]